MLRRWTFFVFCRYEESSGVHLTSWKDKVIHVASNAASCELLSSTYKYFRKERTMRTMLCPQAIELYNTTMVGVDRNDHDIAYYRISVFGKKVVLSNLFTFDWCCRHEFMVISSTGLCYSQRTSNGFAAFLYRAFPISACWSNFCAIYFQKCSAICDCWIAVRRAQPSHCSSKTESLWDVRQ